ncbi:MAG: pyridoxine 5'-phosphate synthase, partial [Gammaproteobacteria bacterium]|nr:pyridoxine 5'-phosphate synthase [Gammaproteobacteria bacterium]
IEIHTGHFADAIDKTEQNRLLDEIKIACEHAEKIGLQVNAGHGLNRQNVHEIAALPQLRELNIGHAIIADSIFMGLDKVICEYRRLMREARI